MEVLNCDLGMVREGPQRRELLCKTLKSGQDLKRKQLEKQYVCVPITKTTHSLGEIFYVTNSV